MTSVKTSVAFTSRINYRRVPPACLAGCMSRYVNAPSVLGNHDVIIARVRCLRSLRTCDTDNAQHGVSN